MTTNNPCFVLHLIALPKLSFFSPSYLGRESAKQPFRSLRSETVTVFACGGGFTLFLFIAERQAGMLSMNTIL